MDDKIRKSCPNCCQLYHIKQHSSCLKGNLPLFLTCGHSICESCVRSLSKFQEPIECKVCLRCMELKPAEILLVAQDPTTLYQMFPVNYLLLGELTLQLMTNVNQRPEISLDDCFIDIQDIMKQETNTKDKCVECHILTYKMCKQCDTILCETCFNKSHKNFVIFKNHALQKIAFTPETNNNCKTHDDKQLDYYCTDCSKAICMDCLLVGSDKSCKEHNLKSTVDINESHMEEIINIKPKVDEMFRRLSKTAVDIGHLLYNIETETDPKSEVTQIIASIEQHFSKLCAVVQNHKQATIEIVTTVKSAERESLAKARSDVYEALKKARHVLKIINSAADTTMFKQLNLSVLLEDAKKIAETPWYLMKEEDQNNPLKMKVNEDLTELMRDFIHLEGNATSVYKLRKPEELKDVEIPPAPTAPVYPPPIPRDVRQLKKANPNPKPNSRPKPKEDPNKPMMFFKQAPNYRSKSGSVNSLNSLSSDSSKQSYMLSDGYQCVSQVKSFPESQEPKPLYEGSQELIYMSHIVDPHNFYVQRASDQRVVKDLLREFRNAVSMPKPMACHVSEGKIYLAFNKADNLWQRCRVIDIDKKDASHPRFIVRCFDFGSIESVSVNNLRLLPPARWNTPPPLAIHCSLANCEPIQGGWMSDDAILIQNILDNKQAVINVRRLIQTENGTTLEVDVTTFEGKVSLAHALVFHDRAKMPKPKLRYPFMNTTDEMPRYIVSNTDFRPKSIDEIQFTHIVSPDMFFIRKRQHQRDYEKMTEELYHAYSLNGDGGKVFLPQIGMACVLNTEKYRNEENHMTLDSNVWARCEVTEIGQRGRIQVLLVDVGARLFVHWTALRTVQMRFTTLRAMTTECHLAGVTPLNKKWSPKSVTLLKSYQNHILEMQVEDSRNRGSIGVTLFDKTDEDNVVCINNEMVRHKYAISFGMFNFNQSPDLQDQAYTYKTPLDRPVQKPNPNKITILKKDPPKIIKEDDLAAKDKGPLKLEAKVLNYISPSIIYMSLVHQRKMFNDMFENLQKYYCHEKVEGKAEWKVGDRCCTICIETQTWRRATILELEGENAKVFYSDFATVETLPTAGLKELVREFLSIGIAAIKCHLSGVMPAIGDEWPFMTKDFLKELLDAYQRLFITKIGHFKDNSMPIEIWVYHTIPGSALEADKSEWRCLNKKIIEQGLGIPIKSDQIDVEKNDEVAEDKEEFLSFLNVTGSVRDWLQLEPMPTKPLLGGRTETESVSGSSTALEYDESNESEAIDFKNQRDIFISEWLPAEPFQNNEFTASATFVDNDGIIYLHDVEQLGTLDIIRNALDVRYRGPDPKAKYTKWSVGEPCVALYHYDNNYYRGRVLDVNETTSTCLVHYIDYGNEELCAYTNMRKGIALHQIPIQAHKCIFARIQPLANHWARQTLDYIHKLIVEKHCYVRVAGKTINGITPIDMKYDKLWINDHLVDFDLAKFSEGCRPIERKYAPAISEPRYPRAVVAAEGDSGPDFIVENENEPDYIEDVDENSFKSVESEDIESEGLALNPLKGKDWNLIIAEDEMDDDKETPAMHVYSKQSLMEFKCNILLINDVETFQLSVVHDANTASAYEDLFDDIKLDGETKPPINGIYKHKACIAIFPEDQQWYRAMILEHSVARHLVKVRFVDYGNVDLVSVDDVREIPEDWVRLPPLTVAAKFHAVSVNTKIDVELVREKYLQVLLNQGPFDASIIDYSDIVPTVELRCENNESIADKLVECGVFVRYNPNEQIVAG